MAKSTNKQHTSLCLCLCLCAAVTHCRKVHWLHLRMRTLGFRRGNFTWQLARACQSPSTTTTVRTSTRSTHGSRTLLQHVARSASAWCSPSVTCSGPRARSGTGSSEPTSTQKCVLIKNPEYQRLLYTTSHFLG